MPPELIVDGSRYLPVKVAARAVDLAPDYVSKLCRAGLVKAHREANAWYVKEDSLHAFVAEQARQKDAWKQEQSRRRKQEQIEAGYYDRVAAPADPPQHPAITTAAPRELHAHVAKRRTASRVFATSILSFALLFSSALAFEIVAPPGSAHRTQLTHAIGASQIAAAASTNILDAVGNFFSNLFHQQTTPTITAHGGAQLPSQSAQPIAHAATTTIIEQHITQPVVERVVEKQVGGVSEATLASRLADLSDSLRNEFSRTLVATNPAPSPIAVPQQVAAGGTTIVYTSSPASERIDKLTNTTITNPSISGGTISGATIDVGSLPGTVGIANGGTATSTAPSYGQLLVGNSAGGYDLLATSSLGIVSSGGTSNFGQAFEISGNYLAPTTTLTVLFPAGLIASASSTIANLSITNSTTTNATSTNFAATNASTTNLTTGSLTVGSGTGVLYASAGSVSAIANGADGKVLKLSGGVPTWGTDLSGSGGGSSAWATTTDNLAVYPADASQVVLVGASATSTTGNIFEVKGNSLFRGTATAYNTITAPSFTATSTTASQLPYASSTAISSSYASSTSAFFGNLSIGNLTGFLKAIGGIVQTALVDLASNVSGILPVANGGTGQGAIAANAIVLGNGSGALATTTAGTNGQVLALVGGIPSWVSTTTLATIGGTLDVSKGGTGATMFSYGLLLGNGTNAITNVATSSLGDTNIPGGGGGEGATGTATVNGPGGGGGNAAKGGTGGVGGPAAGGVGNAGSGFGGGGGGGAAGGSAAAAGGGGGGAGGYASKVISGPSGTYYYTIGSAGAAGGGGSGTGSSAGGAGGPGGLVISIYTTGISNGSLASGTAGQFAFYNAAGTNLSATSSIFVDTTTSRVGIGTTTPGSIFSVSNAANFFSGATSTIYFGLNTPYLNITGASASSTFANGINLTGGCFAVNGTCLGGSGSLSGTLGQLPYFSGTNTAVGTSTLTLSTAGFFGIGTTTPGAKLTVYGDIFAEGSNRYLNFGTVQGTSGYGFRDNSGTLEFKNSGGTWQGVTTATSGPSFMVHKNGTDQTVSNGVVTLLTWSTERFDSNNNFASNRFTPTVPGKYVVTLNVQCANSTGYCVVYIYKNAAVTAEFDGHSGNDQSGTVTAIVDMNGSTDYLEGYVYMSGTTVGGGAHYTYFTGALIAPASAAAGGWQNDNTQSFLADSTDLVGIGTSTPWGKLSIQSTAGIPQFVIGSSTTQFIVDKNGNVGIGTSSPSSTFTLGVTGSGYFSTGVTLGSALAVTSGGTGVTSSTGSGNVVLSSGPTITGNLVLSGIPSGSTGGTFCYNTGTGAVSASSGGTCSGSDERLKTDVADLSGAEGLAAVLALRPVTFNWKDALSAASQGRQLGFIAQEVQSVLPELVLDDSGTTTITLADGSSQEITHTLSLNYQKLVVPLVKAVQEIASITGTFKANLIAWLASAENGIIDFFAKVGNFGRVNTTELCTEKSDGTEVCASGDQLAAILAGTNAGAATATPGGDAGAPASTSARTGRVNADVSMTTTPAKDIVVPNIHINGNNPAIVQVGVSYADLGATITGPEADLNLGTHTFVDGIPTDPVAIDTSVGGTHSIDYVVTDATGLTSTSTRTVIVSAPANDNFASTTAPVANDNLQLAPLSATTTDASSTAQ